MEREILLTPKQVADQLQVSVAWVRDHSTRKQPKLPAIKIGGLLRYCQSDVDKWVGEQRLLGLRRAS